MKKIIIDTNFLLIPFMNKVDIFSELERIIIEDYKVFILDKTINELNNLYEKESGKTKQAVKFALSLINVKQPDIIETEKNRKDADWEIISLCKKEDYMVATQDKLLREQLKLLGRKTIVLRQKKYLILG
jgi:rRNA-processing protein FCF1